MGTGSFRGRVLGEDRRSTLSFSSVFVRQKSNVLTGYGVLRDGPCF